MSSLKCIIKKFTFCTLRGVKGGIPFLSITGSHKTLGNRFWENGTNYWVILEEITTAEQHSPIFNEICTAAPAMQGKLCRSLFPYVNTAKREEREWNLGLWVTKTYYPRFCATLYYSFKHFTRLHNKAIVQVASLNFTENVTRCSRNLRIKLSAVSFDGDQPINVTVTASYNRF